MKKKDNRGLTLVELLVAITILGVVVGPMLHAFVTSVYNNNKARRTLDATTVAQNLMEGMEAYSLEDICRQFNLPDEFNLYQQSTIEGCKEVTADRDMTVTTGEFSGTVSAGATGNEYTFVGTSSNKYYFAVKGLKEDIRTYDAFVTIDASGYRDLSAGNAYNAGSGFSVEAMNASTDVVYTQKKEMSSSAYAKIRTANPTVSEDDIKSKTSRSITITVRKSKEDASEPNPGYYVDVEPKYIYDNGVTKAEFTDSSWRSTTFVTDIRNVYVMYYPDYNSITEGARDTISIVDQVDTDYTVYLIKQKDTSRLDPEIAVDEGVYLVNLEVIDSNLTSADGYISNVQLRSNLGSYVTDEKAENKRNPISSYRYTNAAGTVNLTEAQMKKALGFTDDGYPVSLTGAAQSSNVIYETTVEVYPAGTYDANGFKDTAVTPLATLSSGQ